MALASGPNDEEEEGHLTLLNDITSRSVGLGLDSRSFYVMRRLQTVSAVWPLSLFPHHDGYISHFVSSHDSVGVTS